MKKNKVYDWLVFAFLFGIVELASAQQSLDKCSFMVSGKVIDKSTQSPLPGASVRILQLNKGSSSDEQGKYAIGRLCPGNYTLVCEMVGYSELVLAVNVQADVSQDIFLLEKNIQLAGIEVKSHKQEDITQSKGVLEKKDLEATSGLTLGESLKQLVGVSTLQTGNSIVKPVIHGMHSNRILLINNGIRQEGQQWGAEHAPEIDPFTAQKMTVIKGAAGVRYGSDAIGGVILLEPDKLPDSTRWKGELNHIFLSNGRQHTLSAMLENAITRFSSKKLPFQIGVRLQGTFKKGGNISTPDYNLANTGIVENNFSVATNFQSPKINFDFFMSQFNTTIGIFSGSHIGNINDLQEALIRKNPLPIYTPNRFTYHLDRPYQDVLHRLWKIKLYKTTAWGTLRLTLGKQYNFRREVEVLRGDKNLIQLFDLNTFSNELIWEHKPLLKNLTGSIGLSSLFQENITSGTLQSPTASTVLIPNFKNLTSGIFLIERMIRPKWELETGLRYDFRRLNVFRIPKGTSDLSKENRFNENFTGTIGFNLIPNEHWKVAFNSSSAWRAPSVNELYSEGIHHGAATYEKGSLLLLPEWANNQSIAIVGEWNHWNLDIDLYLNFIKNYIFLAPTGRLALSIRGAFPEFYYTQTDAVFKGIDVASTYQMTKCFSWNTKVSYLKAYDQMNHQALPFIPANRWENVLKWKKKNAFAMISGLWVCQQKNIPTHLIFPQINPQEIIFNQYGGDFAPPPPAYFLLGGMAGTMVKVFNKTDINISIKVDNLLNTKYRDYLNRFRYFSDAIGRNFSIRLKYVF